MNVTLDDAWTKLRWAKRHFEIVRSEIEPFEQRDAHRITVEVDAEKGRYDFYIHDLEVTESDWGLVIGDCLHNARTALDYLAVRLWALVTNQEPAATKGVQFPIYDDPQEFAGRVGKFRKELAFSGYLARIEELQPFNAGNPSIWGTGDPHPHLPYALQRLAFLDNADKHRVLQATWVAPRFGGWLTPDRDAPSEFKPLSGSVDSGPLENGAHIGDYTFEAPLPGEWRPTEVQMKSYFPLRVAFPDPSLTKAVLEILPWCLWGTEAVLEIFRPVFERGAAPLPVIAAQPSQ